MSNEELLHQVINYACSCEPMAGWTCNFCGSVLPKLRKALGADYRLHARPYEPKKLPGTKETKTPRGNNK
jgi:hypothetical protein